MCDMSAGRRTLLLFLGLLTTNSMCMAGCPLGASGVWHGASGPLHHINRIELQSKQQELDFTAVKNDLIKLFKDSQEAWPSDYGHYGGLFIRMAWHCTGSYRSSDGRGGCDGARQRFDPERSWKDNTNLDKARNLLQPIKLKYGPGLSWGDLMVLAGTAAIESMGGPVLGFCAGRIDDYDGSESIELGPSPEQEALAPCPVNGNCSAPLGQDTIGLIYVNPEGPMGEPKPLESAQQIRDVFGRMGMNDSETAALIGGGHAFGKTHGACPTGPGPAPNEDESNPWPGTCGSGAMKGKGPNTFTSGLEGPWTVNPTKWDNDYFKNLINYDWELYDSPGGAKQWRPVQKAGGPEVPKDVMMLTTDVALIYDPIYLELVKKWAEDIKDLEHAFSHAWYKLATRDMGPVTRCLGPDVPPAQDFQFPLPPTPEHLADFDAVQKDIQAALRTKASLTPDKADGKPYYGALFATLAWQCASTFRQTDYMGGCNGARIRFSPQKDWPVNKGMDQVLAVLAGIKKKYEGKGALSWADLLVLAGQTAVEDAGGAKMKFCGGRTDDVEGSGSAFLAPRSFKDPVLEVKDTAKVMGLSNREVVALAARLRSPSQQSRLGYSGSWTSAVSTLSSSYYKTLLTETWKESDLGGGKAEYQAGSQPVYMLPTDLALKWNPVYAAIAQEYASDEATFKAEFAAAWTKVMNMDRFDGPSANLCNKPQVELHNITAGVMDAF